MTNNRLRKTHWAAGNVARWLAPAFLTLILAASGTANAQKTSLRFKGFMAGAKVKLYKLRAPNGVHYKSRFSVNWMIRSTKRFNKAFKAVQQYGKAATGNAEAEAKYRALARDLRQGGYIVGKNITMGRTAEPGRSILAKHKGLIEEAQANLKALKKVPAVPEKRGVAPSRPWPR